MSRIIPMTTSCAPFWTARVSTEYSTGVQGVAAHAARIAAKLNGQTSVDDIDLINAELGALRQAIHRIQKRGREDKAADKASRAAIRKATAKYAREERKAASERNRAVADALAGARHPPKARSAIAGPR